MRRKTCENYFSEKWFLIDIKFFFSNWIKLDNQWTRRRRRSSPLLWLSAITDTETCIVLISFVFNSCQILSFQMSTVAEISVVAANAGELNQPKI